MAAVMKILTVIVKVIVKYSFHELFVRFSNYVARIRKRNALFHNSCHKWEPQYPENSTACDWAPFDGSDHDSLLGSLDLAYLFAYAVGMFLSGHIAERMNLRYFLTLGMLLSGITTAAFGFGYFFKIHVLWFFVLVQVVGGMVQASGWPSVVTCVGNWWGKGKRGFIMGVWNSHTSVGNITGSLIAGIWVNHAWGWSFAVPGMIIGGLGIIVFLFLVTEPSVVGCEEPDQPDPDELVTSDSVHIQNDRGPVPNDKPGTETTSLDSAESSTIETNGDAKPINGIAVKSLDPKLDDLHFSQNASKVDMNNQQASLETKLSSLQNGSTVASGHAKSVELLSIQNLDNQSKTGNGSMNSGSEVKILVQGQNGGVAQIKKTEFMSDNDIPMTDLDEDDQDYNSATSVTPLLKRPVSKSEEKAIPLYRAVLIPGVLEFSLCLFFAKLVSYTFLFWLPKYIHQKNPSFNAEESADLSTLFDVGGILGGITAGIISDYTGARASTCAVMLILAAPMMYILNVFGAIDYAHTVGLLIACGYLVNGPYALITTAVSADLGTHKSLQGNSKALATVTAIIDGTGSIGAAIGPLLTGVLWKYGTMAVFWMLIGADIAALIFLTRLVIKEIRASRFCSPPLLIDDIVVDNTDSSKIEKSEHF